jgi:hypothetical protein
VKALVLSDIHSEEAAIEKLRVFLEINKFNLVIIVGDITQRGPVSYAEEFLDLFRGMNVLAIHGNMDPKPVIDLLERRGLLFHLKKVDINGWNFIGFGGSGPTPFGTPTEYSEEEIYNELSKFRMDRKTVLVTHSPPFNSEVDRTASGKSAGSRAIRRIIEEKKPFMNICGHVHEREGETSIGDTRIVKVPPAVKGRAVEIDFDRNLEIKFMPY